MRIRSSNRSSSLWSRWARDESGQDLLEWTVTLPVFMALCVGIAFYFWLWWNQVSAAAAVHDGTYLAAIKGGDAGAGYARIERMLQASVGNFKTSYSVRIAADSPKSVRGAVQNNRLFRLPFLGLFPFVVRAQSFQRQEQFYGGPPGKGPGPWWW